MDKKKPDLSNLRLLGCTTFAHIPTELKGKMDDKAKKCIMLGYYPSQKEYRLWDETNQKVFSGRDVTFIEETEETNQKIALLPLSVLLPPSQTIDKTNASQKKGPDNDLDQNAKECVTTRRSLRPKRKLRNMDNYVVYSSMTVK